MNKIDLDSKVKEANKKFYNAIADIYEKTDGRRTKVLEQWLESKLKGLSNDTEGVVLLDLGCGTGVVLKSGRKFFKYSYGIDLSLEMLRKVNGNGKSVICADFSFIPFKDESVDVVVCFAVLHHSCDYESVLKGAYRVLRKGGMLYIDHDIDRTFVTRFYPLVKIYRYMFNPASKYIRLKRGLTKELYNLSEIHSEGIDSVTILNQLIGLGFSKIEVYYHWFGLNGILNKIIRFRKVKIGCAPLTCIIVKK